MSPEWGPCNRYRVGQMSDVVDIARLITACYSILPTGPQINPISTEQV